MDIQTLAKGISVSAQIEPEDLKRLKREGFTDIVCNRPDEEHVEGPTSGVISKMADRLGLRFHYLPIQPNEDFSNQSQTLHGLLREKGVKVLAYCRTGNRSQKAWELDA